MGDRLWMTMGLAALLPMAAVAADEPTDDDAEVTITVLEEGAQPDQLLNSIELPEEASETGAENSAEGLDTANSNRERSANVDELVPEAAQEGRERAESARESASDAANDAADDIRDQIGSREIDELPDDVRDNIPDDLPIPEDDDLPIPPPPEGDGG